MEQTETDAPTLIQILTGHYRVQAPYTTWRPRGTNDWLLMATISGLGRVGFHGGEIAAAPGDAILLRPGTLHDYGTARRARSWGLVWAHFHPRPDWLTLLDWPESAHGLMHIAMGQTDAANRIVEALLEMHARSTGAQLRREAFAMNSLERALLLLDTINPASAESRIDSRVLLAMEILLRDLSGRFTLTLAAEACSLSPSRLAHLFTQQAGITPQRFVERERLTRAGHELTLTDRPINAISADLGFESPFYFSRRFKMYTGESPRDYRAGRNAERQGGISHVSQ